MSITKFLYIIFKPATDEQVFYDKFLCDNHMCRVLFLSEGADVPKLLSTRGSRQKFFSNLSKLLVTFT